MAQRQSLIREFWIFLMSNKKWWLIPMVVILAGFAVLIFLSSTAVAPFVYTLF
jgi:hypothetical protein